MASFVGDRARGFLPSVDGLLDGLPPFYDDADAADASGNTGRGPGAGARGAALGGPGLDAEEGAALVELLARFGPALRDIFGYFATVPSASELLLV